MKIKTERKPNPHARKYFVAFKVSLEELKALEEKAQKHADGNLSAYIRYASMQFKP